MSRCPSPERLADLARGRLAPAGAAELARHVEGCAACRASRARIDGALEAFDAARELPAPEPSLRTEAAIRWLRLPERRPVRPVLLWAGGALAVAGVAVWLSAGRGAAVGRTEIAARPTAGPSPDAPRDAAAPPAAREAGAVLAWVTLAAGPAELERAGTRRPLIAGERLGEGDRVSTGPGGRVAAQWAEGAGFLVGAEAELSLEVLRARAQRLALPRGQVAVRVPHGVGDALSVVTPGHVVSVRGTWFAVGASGARTRVEVLEGAVEVAEPDGRVITLLKAPSRGEFERGRALTAAIGAGDLSAARVRADTGLQPFAGLGDAGRLTLAPEPAAQVSLDGEPLGSSPASVLRPRGRHLVELERHGFDPIRRWIALGPEPEALRDALPARPTKTPLVAPGLIEAAVRRHAGEIRACYERGLKRDPSIAGTIALRMSIGASGGVRSARIESTTLADEQVGECLAREAKGWTFDAGQGTTVVYPFVFRARD